MIGTVEEAQEIFDAVGRPVAGLPPAGWREIGAGGTRHCYLSPSGVVYKICYNNGDERPGYNEREHDNLEKIRNGGKLPKGWRVPKSHLHSFRSNIERWNVRLQKEEVVPAQVSVIAMEYISGKRLGSMCDNISGNDWWDMEEAFKAVGLHDTGGANAIKAEDGTRYIIDAAEYGALIGV